MLGVDPASSADEVTSDYGGQTRLLHQDGRAGSPRALADATRAVGELDAAFDALVGTLPRPAEPPRFRRVRAALWTRRYLNYVGLLLIALLVATIWIAKSGSIAKPKAPIGAANSAASPAADSPVPGVAPATGEVASTPTIFPVFVQNLQGDLRSGLIPGVAAGPGAAVNCPGQDPLFPGDVFACNVSGYGPGPAQAVVTVEAPHGQLFTVAIGSAWSCGSLSGSEVAALQGLGAAASC